MNIQEDKNIHSLNDTPTDNTQCDTKQCDTKQCDTKQCDTIQCDTIQNQTKKEDMLFKLLKIINISVNNKDHLDNITFERDILIDSDTVEKYYELIPELKIHYNSDTLTCLHKNSTQKQKFPAVNMLRQILRCNSFKLKPKVVSLGYVNHIKVIKRYFTIIKVELDTN